MFFKLATRAVPTMPLAPVTKMFINYHLSIFPWCVYESFPHQIIFYSSTYFTHDLISSYQSYAFISKSHTKQFANFTLAIVVVYVFTPQPYAVFLPVLLSHSPCP